MNPIFDTAMLKHHRVDYSRRVETDGARRPARSGRIGAYAMITVILMIPFGALLGFAA